MMSAVPEPHDLHQPTAQMPVVEPRGVYRAANHRRTALIVAAGAAAVLLMLVVWLFSGDDTPAPQAPVAAPTVSSAPAAVPSETAEPSPSETVEASPATGVPQRPAQPGELILALASVVDGLEDRDELDDDGAEALNRRLEQAAARLSRGDAKGASRKIEEFTKKLRDLREDDDLSEDAFTLLNTGADRIRVVLPSR